VRIEDNTLSRRHARITIEGSRLGIQDLGSANGIYVNETRVDQATLRPGDELRLGGRSFVVVGPDRTPRGGGDDDSTVVEGGRPDGRPQSGNASTEILGAAEPVARLVEQSEILGADVELPLSGPWHRLGRDESNDFVIPDGSISRLHATLTLAGDAWRIQDAQSSNGVLVNGQRVDSATLKDGDEIQLGRATFLFNCSQP